MTSHATEVDILTQHAVTEKALVKIYGTNQSLKGVPIHIIIVRRGTVCHAPHQAIELHFDSHAIKGLALHDFAPRSGEKAFVLAHELSVNNITHNSFQDCIAKELQPLIVQRKPLFGTIDL